MDEGYTSGGSGVNFALMSYWIAFCDRILGEFRELGAPPAVCELWGSMTVAYTNALYKSPAIHTMISTYKHTMALRMGNLIYTLQEEDSKWCRDMIHRRAFKTDLSPEELAFIRTMTGRRHA